MKKAIISGITGQDGSYLAELLLREGYRVYGMVRRSSTENFERINHIKDQVELVQGDLLDQLSLINLIRKVRPREIYNLAAQSFVPTSFEQPVLTGEFTGLGVTKFLEAIRLVDRKVRFYQASSSEMYGHVDHSPQNEKTPLKPCNPYGAAKAYGHWMCQIYRSGYKIFAVSGILFNHESPRRGKEFVSRRISYGVAKIKLGLAKTLMLGNLKAKRDWGYAGDYVKAMWLMLQQPKPNDYVVATGKAHSVEDFVRIAFERVNLSWKKYVRIDPALVRPTELHILCGDSSKARKVLGWKPQMSFRELVHYMIDEDVKRLSNEAK